VKTKPKPNQNKTFQLDKFEDRLRRRRRLVRNYHGTTHPEAVLISTEESEQTQMEREVDLSLAASVIKLATHTDHLGLRSESEGIEEASSISFLF